MKTNNLSTMKKIFCIITLVMAFSAAAAAQELRTAYFLDAYNFRHQMNPAFASARSYFTIPALGYMNLQLQSNMGVKTFLYPMENGQLTTFMNSSVSRDTFMKNLHKNNILSTDVSTSLFSIGAWGKRNGFTTVELNLKANVAVNLPKDLFGFMKNVGNARHYDISNLGARARAYMELSLGHTQRLSEKLSVGAKVKFLLGVANADLNIDRMNINMTEDEWSVKAQGSMRASAGGMLTIPTYAESGRTEEGARPDQIDFKGIDIDPASAFREKGISAFLNGFGAAIDLGGSYEIFQGLTVSAAILDLGFISWKDAVSAATDENSWSFKGFDEFSFDGKEENGIGKQFENLGDEFEDMIVLYKKNNSKYTEMLATTINAAVEYDMPFWDKMSVGALLTSRIQGPYSWTEGRLSVNFAFGDVFALSGSYAYSNFGSTFGFAWNLHCRAVSLYCGIDSIPTRYSAPIQIDGSPIKIKAPIGNMNLCMNFGLAFNVSKRKDKTFR